MTQSKYPETTLRLAPATALEVKALSDAGEFTGYGSVFGNVDAYGDRVMPGAFAATLADYKAKGTAPAMLWQHNADWPIGVWTDIREDSRGLYVAGQLNLETDKGREAHALLKQRAISGLSIGFKAPPGARQRQDDGTSNLTSVDLWEVSLVTFPANAAATVLSAKSITSQADFERLLKQNGFPNRAARKLAEHGWAGLSPETITADIAREVREIADLFRKGT